MESTLYEGLAELFPESYSSGGFNTADSGKLLVLSDLLAAIRQISPSDRFVDEYVYVFAFLSIYTDKVCVPLQGSRSVQLYADT